MIGANDIEATEPVRVSRKKVEGKMILLRSISRLEHVSWLGGWCDRSGGGALRLWSLSMESESSMIIGESTLSNTEVS